MSYIACWSGDKDCCYILDIMDDNFIEKMKFIENIESLIPNPNRFFEKLICFKEITMDLEKVLFFIVRDKYNEKTSYQKSIYKVCLFRSEKD